MRHPSQSSWDAVVVSLLLATTATTTALSNGPTVSFPIGQLLSTCVDACQRGCHEIRKVQTAREQALRDSDNSNDDSKNEEEDNLQVQLKDPNDPRSALTLADQAAHQAIVTSLRQEWGNQLNIVSEEDNDDGETTTTKNDNDMPPLNRHLFDDDMGEETAALDAQDVTIFIDPLDGTREFVEGRLENCQVLVGLAFEGQPVGGAIGLPFPLGNSSTPETVIYGMADVGTGVLGHSLKRGPFPLDHHIDGIRYPRPHFATGDSEAPVMMAAKEAAIKRVGGSNVIYGGAGNKILGAALGEVAASIQHKVGGPWDLCAPQAILYAMGGTMTDLFGQPIEPQLYLADGLKQRCNERGYVATPPGSGEHFHTALVNVLLDTPEVQEYRDQVMEGCEGAVAE
mmetsp:Transcript_3013/g.8499  ORF Transcript_3013/g.8499 Transcript_3013/m.8499 type:complete len:398 (-) Transcript_3013:350-1543(-)